MIKNFHITPANRDNLFAKISALDPHKSWICNITEKKTKRSNSQNKWIRGFAAAFGEHFGYSPDEAYSILMYKFCPEFTVDMDTGEEIRMPGHFSMKQDRTPRDTKDAAEIQDAITVWSAQHGFVWSNEHVY
jgi:hypothetical protein